jgi:hypothetical protein
MSAQQNTQAPLDWLETEDRIDIRSPGLRISFTRVAGSWTHSLLLSDDGNSELARPLEIPAEHTERGRIVRPVFDELVRHEGGDTPGLCLLLTGRLFHHHFSAVVTIGVDPERPGNVMVDFDVADRCRGPVKSLTASYLVQFRGNTVVDPAPKLITWDKVDGCESRLELEAFPPTSLGFTEAGRNAVGAHVFAEIRPGNFTHRLRYRWRWTTSSGLTR